MVSSLPLKGWVPNVHKSLAEVISSSPGLACFDFDNTLIRNDFGEKLMAAVISEGMKFLPPDLSAYFRDVDYWKDHTTKSLEEKEYLIWEEYTYQLKEFGIEHGYRWTSFIFQGFTKDEFSALSKRTWDKVSFPHTEGSVFPQAEMLDLVEFLSEHKWEIFIVTASPEQGISAIAHHFPISEANVIGMRQEKNENGTNAPRIIEPYTYGEGKVKAMEERIGRMPDLAFGDSFNDLPMLCSAKKLAIAIDRGNPEFRAACLDKGIMIQPYFPHPLD